MDSRAGYYATIENVKRDDINKLIHVLRALRLCSPAPLRVTTEQSND